MVGKSHSLVIELGGEVYTFRGYIRVKFSAKGRESGLHCCKLVILPRKILLHPVPVEGLVIRQSRRALSRIPGITGTHLHCSKEPFRGQAGDKCRVSTPGATW